MTTRENRPRMEAAPGPGGSKAMVTRPGCDHCDVVYVRPNRRMRRRMGLNDTGLVPVHADQCPIIHAGANYAPGWHAAGRARSAFRAVTA